MLLGGKGGFITERKGADSEEGEFITELKGVASEKSGFFAKLKSGGERQRLQS